MTTIRQLSDTLGAASLGDMKAKAFASKDQAVQVVVAKQYKIASWLIAIAVTAAVIVSAAIGVAPLEAAALSLIGLVTGGWLAVRLMSRAMSDVAQLNVVTRMAIFVLIATALLCTTGVEFQWAASGAILVMLAYMLFQLPLRLPGQGRRPVQAPVVDTLLSDLRSFGGPNGITLAEAVKPTHEAIELVETVIDATPEEVAAAEADVDRVLATVEPELTALETKFEEERGGFVASDKMAAAASHEQWHALNRGSWESK